MNTDEWVHYTVNNALKEERDSLIEAMIDIANTTTEVGTLIKADKVLRRCGHDVLMHGVREIDNG